MAIPDLPPPLLNLDDDLDTERIQEIITDRLGTYVDSYLFNQRWFGDKDRPLMEVMVIDAAVEPVATGWYVLASAIVVFDDGSDPADYLLLLAVLADDGTSEAEHTLLRLQTPDGTWLVADIAAAPGFPAWWLDRFATDAVLPSMQGQFRWTRLPGFDPAARDAGPGRLILGGMGQSNTTVRYADALFGKIFRRLREGINPDEEISRFLAGQTPFRHLPVPYGTATYETSGGMTFPVGVLFSFVPSVGDGWEWTQDLLAGESLASYADAARRLGERTGQLHLALASDDSNPDFASEPVTDTDISYWEHSTAAGVRALCEDLRLRRRDLPPAVLGPVQALLDQKGELVGRVAGYRDLLGTVKTRIHGDYHLGQVLRTPDEDWVLLDFEGEPARTIEQRRAKTSPLKDVADMLRSFGYARGMAARAADADRERLLLWERDARAAFLAGYRGEVARAAVALVPAGDAAFDRAIAAWELAKAIYEVRYELGNRPDWLDVPIRTLIVRQEPPAH